MPDPETQVEKPYRATYRTKANTDKAKWETQHTVIKSTTGERGVRIHFWNNPCWNRAETRNVELVDVKEIEPEE